MRLRWLLTIALFSLSAPAAATPGFRSADAAARFGLREFRQLLEADPDAAELGFRDGEEAAPAQLRTPITVLAIGLDRLRSWKPGASIRSMVRETDQKVYPVYLGEEARALIVVARVRGKWIVLEAGSPGVAQPLEAARRAIAAKPEEPRAPPPVLVRVPALNLYFLGLRGQGDDLRLVLLHPTEALPEVKPGTPIQANDAFRILSANANSQPIDRPR